MSERRVRWVAGFLLPGADKERGRADDYVFEGEVLVLAGRRWG